MLIVQFGQSPIPCGRLNPQFCTWKKKEEKVTMKNPTHTLSMCKATSRHFRQQHYFFQKNNPSTIAKLWSTMFYTLLHLCSLNTWKKKKKIAHKLGAIACNLKKKTHTHTQTHMFVQIWCHSLLLIQRKQILGVSFYKILRSYWAPREPSISLFKKPSGLLCYVRPPTMAIKHLAHVFTWSECPPCL
jgi:hypothetical protein